MRAVVGCASLAAVASIACGQTLQFENETNTRMIVNTPDIAGDPVGIVTDNQEKDFAWGDVNNDGWTDLVTVRKQPFTSPGRRRNLLFINENGVLIDRTADYATAVALDQLPEGASDEGFYTQTNDRDVVLSDVNDDGWLDIVTATTISDGQPKHIGHPRIYINLGEDGNGDWLGFRFENDRIPQMLTDGGTDGINPRFCSLAAGDLTGDGYDDLYFGDYDSSGAGGSGEPGGIDYNNKLLINLGAANPGYFVDESELRMTQEHRLSAFGAASQIADMNNDGVNDVVKQTSLNPPQHVAIVYNNPDNIGFFNGYEIHNQFAPYFVSVGDLNNDGLLDLVVTDDGTDRYHLNQGIGGDGFANFNSSGTLFPGSTGGFGSQSAIADIDNDGWLDVAISDVDVDIGGCDRTTDILRNNGNAPNVTFTPIESTWGIPSNTLTGVHNTAVFDINNDGWLDFVFGRCSGTQVWMAQPPIGIDFSYPKGQPTVLTPGEPTTVQVQLAGVNGSILGGSGEVHVSIDGGAFSSSPMTDLGSNLYELTLPALDCGSSLEYYVSAQLSGGQEFNSPENAPLNTFFAFAIDEITLISQDDIEGDVSTWTVNSVSLSSGEWEQAVPNGTVNSGDLAAPNTDANSEAGLTQAFVTENGPANGSASANDVDGGPTYLTSPTIDLNGTDASISYALWFYSDNGSDVLTVEVSNNNGATWTHVETVTDTASSWQTRSFVVSDVVTPTDQVRVRFSTVDAAPPSITEAGVDIFQVSELVCDGKVPCLADLSGDQNVDAADLGELLANWGACKGCPADFNGDNIVGAADLGELLANWGACK
jgi:hypothetical protein